MTRAKAPPAGEGLSRKEAARYLGSIGCLTTPRALEKRASHDNAGRGPPFTRIGWRCVRYQRGDLEQWARAQMMRVE